MSADLLLRAVRVAGAGRELLPTDEPIDILIRAGLIADIAPTGNLRASAETLDGDGAWVIPGLWDHHVHTVQWALAAQREPLDDTRSAAEAAARMGGAPVLPDGRRIGTGFRHALWADVPSRALLDAATGEIPTYLINSDVHSVWLNSAALRREGMDGQDDDGMLREEPAFEISRRLNAVDDAVADAAVLAAARRAAARGVVGTVDFDMAWNATAWSRRLDAGFDLHRVEFAVYPEQLDRAIAEGLKTGDPVGDGGLVRMGALKVIADGSLGTRTAACSHAYDDGTGAHGAMTVPPAQLHELLARAATGGIEAAVHAIGDLTVTAALDAFTATGQTGTIEHAQLVRHADLARFARLGVAASVQPRHTLDDRPMIEQFWASQTSIVYPLASLHAAGAGLRFSSDAPVSALDPWEAISAAVTREAEDGTRWHPEERVGIDIALRASAHRGTDGTAAVAPGAVADLVLCGADPRTADAATLRTMPVEATLVAGRRTH
ncbi:metal-dependent hydrolase [Microbacterium bovistercoris]|uniref:Metal-dependent hydrolase n=1 Tax=Microbacterium bovistercoris TaxID=2293570 RepID=A0A371NTG7_9MICO|nr:amidohydrolase family protein [Microbacterium bovistercoris]REJ05594.1 metal-dependent hydrolase [Microbacterium bovistercoris]